MAGQGRGYFELRMVARLSQRRKALSGLITRTLSRLEKNRPSVSVTATATKFRPKILLREPRASTSRFHSSSVARTTIRARLATSSDHSPSCLSRSSGNNRFPSKRKASPAILTGKSDRFVTTIPTPHSATSVSVPSSVSQYVGDFLTMIRSWSRRQFQYATAPVNTIVAVAVSTVIHRVNVCSGVICLVEILPP